MQTRTYLIFKVFSDNKEDVEEIRTNDMDVVLKRASDLMKSEDVKIQIWEKKDYELYKKRERAFA